MIGEGTQTLKWPRAVIRTLSDKIKSGIKFFVGHGQDNSIEDRKSVGEVLSSFTKEIKGKLSNIIIGWFPDKEQVMELDICSMEADVHTDGENVVGDINEVTGVALASSEKTAPAFPGALRLNMVQCFTELIKPKEGDNKMELKDITIGMVKERIKDLNIFPWQLFSLEDFKGDQNMGKVFEELSTLKAENEKLSKENKEISEKGQEAVRKSEVSGAQEKLDGLMKEGFTDLQKTFIKKEFNPESEKDLSDEGLGKYIENSKKRFAENAKLFGVKDIPSLKPGSSSESSDEDDMEKQALEAIGAIDSEKSK